MLVVNRVINSRDWALVEQHFLQKQSRIYKRREVIREYVNLAMVNAINGTEDVHLSDGSILLNQSLRVLEIQHSTYVGPQTFLQNRYDLVFSKS
jgi:hypothetical protein